MEIMNIYVSIHYINSTQQFQKVDIKSITSKEWTIKHAAKNTDPYGKLYYLP